ncbi:MAG: hypothetical protein EOP40_11530 [Rubrivivax sp.]|nr:MAG: hypothetical protein EOP40_11530 [Rubrivivax sp.]
MWDTSLYEPHDGPPDTWRADCAAQLRETSGHTLTAAQSRCEASLLQKAYGSTTTARQAADDWFRR